MDDAKRIIMARPVDPAQYTPVRQALWRRVIAEAGRNPTIYPDSVQMACEMCGIAVWVGPRQRAFLDEEGKVGRAPVVLCMLCIGHEVVDADSVAAIDLGNPHQPE
jgi:hypothetical protein